jgi:outer membrane protein assembly factor BamB
LWSEPADPGHGPASPRSPRPCLIRTFNTEDIAVRLTAALLAWMALLQGAFADNWPRFRGPAGTGHTAEKGLPVTWDEKNVVWKTPLKGKGQSTPVIWGDRIFLTSAIDNGKERLVMAIDRHSGKVLWEHVAWKGVPEPSHNMNGWATPTCVTDGVHVYAAFGKAGLHCYTVEGEHVWSRDLGQFMSKTKRGTAASPILAGNVVVWNGDSESDPFLFGLDKKTGETVWKADRAKKEGYSTPLLITANGRQELVLNGDPNLAAYDPATGKQLWFCKNFSPRGEPAPAYANGLLYVINGQPGDFYALRPGGSGNVTKTQMVWNVPRNSGRDQASPLVIGDHVLVTNIEGIMACYQVKDGQELWKERFSTKTTASPVAAEGKAYFQSENGQTVVIEPGPALKIVARNSVGPGSGEIFRAQPVPCEGKWFIRSDQMLYCVGK